MTESQMLKKNESTKRDKAQLIGIWGYVITSSVCLFIAIFELFLNINNRVNLPKIGIRGGLAILFLVLGIALSIYGLITLLRRTESGIAWRLIVSGISLGSLGAVISYFSV